MAVNVAIIDTGINKVLLDNDTNLIQTYVADEKDIKEIKDNQPCNNMHGTVCTRIITNLVTDCFFKCINIIDDQARKGKIEVLLNALEWSMENQIDLIHLSVGTTDFRDFKKVEEKIDEIRSRGIIIVAANQNDDLLTYPAALPGVIGVRYLKRKNQNNSYIYNKCPADGIDIEGCFDYTVEELFKEKIKSTSKIRNIIVTDSNSYTAPFITAKVCNWMKEGVRELCQIRKLLQAQAINQLAYKKIYSTALVVKRRIEVPNIIIYNIDSVVAQGLCEEVVRLLYMEQYNGVVLGSADMQTKVSSSIYSIESNGEIGISSIQERLVYLYSLTMPDCMITVIKEYKELEILRKYNLVDIVIMEEKNSNISMKKDLNEKYIKVGGTQINYKEVYGKIKQLLS